MEIKVKINKNLPHDDFYLQWEHIFWWQFRFNLDYVVRGIMNDLNENCR